MEKIKLIGNGNIGSNIANYLVSKAYRFKFYKSLKNSIFTSKDEDFETMFYFFAVPDDKVLDLINSLRIKNSRSIYVYFSASISRKQFSKRIQSHVIQFHPMHTFPNKEVIDLSEITFLLSGLSENRKKIKSLFKQVNFIEREIQFCEAYHLLGLFSSNFQIALMHICKNLAKKNQINYADLKTLVIPMMKRTVENIERNAELKDALSGPIKRGDYKTIQMHEAYLEQNNRNYLDLYRILTDELKEMLDNE